MCLYFSRSWCEEQEVFLQGDWSITLSPSDVCLREERSDLSWIYLEEMRMDFLLIKGT